MADSIAGLFPIASLTMVWITIESNLGTLVAPTGLVAGLRGRLPRGGDCGRLSWYGLAFEGSMKGVDEEEVGFDDDVARLWS